MKIYGLGLLLLTLGGTATAYSQEKKPLQLTTETGLSTLWNPHANLSPFGLKYQSEYFGLMPAVHAQLMIQYTKGEALGLEAQGFQRRVSLPELSSETRIRQNYIGLAWAKTYPVSRRGFFLRQSTSVGATYTDALAQTWRSREETRAHAWGMGVNYRWTLSYRIGRHTALGVQVGLGAYSSFRWRGTSDPQSYTGGLFGKDTNVGLYPSIGIVLTDPLGR